MGSPAAWPWLAPRPRADWCPPPLPRRTSARTAGTDRGRCPLPGTASKRRSRGRLWPLSGGQRLVAPDVGVRMGERVSRLGAGDLEHERLARAVVLDGDRHSVGPRVPQQPDVEAVAAAVIQFAYRQFGKVPHRLVSWRANR